MNSLRAAAPLLAILIWASGVDASADMPAPTPAPNAAPDGLADFGSPPSGEIPILYNDHTVYAKPDILRRRRVLAAFIEAGKIFVPLRSMFEQMGATVTASADGKTFTATKPGTTVSVRLGSNAVTINGETRLLDVPPVLYDGVVLVPIRVISEALGAYVLWVPDKRLVVVRYIPAPPPSAPPVVPPTAPPVAPPAAPIPPPAATPIPIPAQTRYGGFIEAAVSAARNYNEFSDGQFCHSFLVSAGYAFANSPLAVKVDYRFDSYVTTDNYTDALKNEYTRFATIPGGYAMRPVFLASQSSIDERLEYRVAAPQIYIGVGYVETNTNYGYPQLSGAGAGIEKLPELHPGISLSGSVFYYPSASGNYTAGNAAGSSAGTVYRQQYAILKYDVGASIVFGRVPIYLYGGFSGDSYTAKQNAPIGQSHAGPYIGLGAKL